MFPSKWPPPPGKERVYPPFFSEKHPSGSRTRPLYPLICLGGTLSTLAESVEKPGSGSRISSCYFRRSAFLFP